MKTLNEHNKDSNEHNKDSHTKLSSTPVLAGVLCNICGVEMIMPQPDMVLLSWPAKVMVQCPKCNVIDYKVK